MTKKVLFILSTPPPYGGGEIVSQLLYENLKSYPNYFFHIVNRLTHNKSLQANITLRSYFWGIIYLFKIIFSLFKIHPTIIYIGLPKSFPAFIRNSIIIHLAYFRKKIIYAELHGMSFPFLKNTYTIGYFKKTINKISKIRVLSNSIKSYLRSTGYNGNIFVIDNAVMIPHGIDLSVRKEIIEPIKLLYLGAISQQKGFNECLNLVNLLKAKGINFQLNVIGEWIDKKFKEDSLTFIERNHLNNEIIFYGVLLDFEKWQQINNNNFIIYLSKFDGQPLALIETMACGVPAFSYNVGAIGEMINNGHNGFIIKNWQEILTILEDFIKLKLDYKDISNNARLTYANKFSPDKMIKNIIHMINC